MARSELQPDLFENSDAEANSLSGDLLVGADQIARFFGWVKDGKPNARRVYHLAEKGRLPIHKMEGLGLVARRSSLIAHFEKLDEQLADRSDGGNPSS